MYGNKSYVIKYSYLYRPLLHLLNASSCELPSLLVVYSQLSVSRSPDRLFHPQICLPFLVQSLRQMNLCKEEEDVIKWIVGIFNYHQWQISGNTVTFHLMIVNITHDDYCTAIADFCVWLMLSSVASTWKVLFSAGAERAAFIKLTINNHKNNLSLQIESAIKNYHPTPIIGGRAGGPKFQMLLFEFPHRIMVSN